VVARQIAELGKGVNCDFSTSESYKPSALHVNIRLGDMSCLRTWEILTRRTCQRSKSRRGSVV
jgi:hypothetical protein